VLGNIRETILSKILASSVRVNHVGLRLDSVAIG
jgi:hypothetical protein